MKKYVASEFFSALDKIDSDMNQYTETLSNVHSAIQGVVNLGDNLTGQGGEALKNFYANNHVPLLSYWTMACQQVKIATAKMRMNALSFESNDAVIDESFIEGEVIPQLETNKRRIQEREDNINSIIDSVFDIVSLPRFDTSAVQKGIHDAKQHAMNTVEKLYDFDHVQSTAVDQLISLMAPISSFIAGLNGAIESGVNITALAGYIASQEVPPEIKAMHPMLNGTYNVLTPYQNFQEQAVHTQNFLLSPNPFGFIHFSNPFILNAAKRLYLAGGHIDVVHHYSPDHQIAGTTVDANGNEIQDVAKMGQGEIINDWGDGHVEVKGEYIDIDAIKEIDGVRVNTFTAASGKELHYTVIDNQFIFFRNDPNLHYYTNGSVQSVVNWTLAHGAMVAGGVITYNAYRSFKHKEWKQHAKEGSSFGQHLGDGGSWKEGVPASDRPTPQQPKTITKEVEIQEKTVLQQAKDKMKDRAKGVASAVIPIIGTEIPSPGSQEIIIWLSEDEGKTWDTKIYVTVTPGGTPTIEDYEDRKNIIDKVVDYFSSQDDK
ncbi:LXG domain-containing protein [Shouchella clausii]|uniref:LXG domain-containing protein n=1 Tax=Shouchella clausii TaxID=79880 RepID=UPI000BA5477F|nr:LXG domain-containing protein [Shouchella clausii]MEB5478668.1 LXG domain-containing protein [Shouchella clausii]PAD12928.1 hypothetical protein CHH74_13150 [Shouchella clausii]